MSLPKILVAAPTSNYKDYCFHEWANQVTSFDYPNYDVVLCDNSLDPNYHHKIWREGLNCLYIDRKHPQMPPIASYFDLLAISMNVLKEVFIRGGYDYWFILETDVFVPDWIIRHLIAQPRQIVNVAYMLWDEPAPSIHMTTGQHSQMVTPDVGFRIYNGECVEMHSTKIAPDMSLWGTGYGCTMVHKSVINQITFRTDYENDMKIGKLTAPDTFFHRDIEMLGIENYLETAIIADHHRGNWQNLF